MEKTVISGSVITEQDLAGYQPHIVKTGKRLDQIDLLRGTVMIIMAIDHTRDYFHRDAFLYSPTDLSQTSVFLFFTRLITHYCAPVFVFLAGVSAYLYGTRRTKKQLSFFLFTRGLFLLLAEPLIITLLQTFNPAYPVSNLQVIFAIGVSMMVLSALVYLQWRTILVIGILLVAGHNLLDRVHVPGHGGPSFVWALLHDPGEHLVGSHTFFVHYPVIPWIGIIALGYCLGSLYTPGYDAAKRKKTLMQLGVGAIVLFILLRSGNWYGDAAHWSSQKNGVFTILSFLNVTKYPPSLQYALLTLGPALLFLAFTEKPLNAIAQKVTVFGRVPMFYYLAHILLIHGLAIVGAMIQGHSWRDMILTTRVNSSPALKGYGFDLLTVYLIWACVILILYPFCKWFDQYKRTNGARHWWLSYL